MSVKYKEFGGLNLPSIEQEILAKWEENRAFEKSVELRDGAETFVFYEGPPSANGMPGIHHVIGRTLKDLVCRYKTMRGYQVRRKGGWDTHGLPVELGVEKELGITKEDIGKKISVEAYNRKCREAVMRYKDQWEDLTRKMGYWVDLKNPYITFENNYIESLWWLLKKLYDKGLLYEDVSIQPYSPAAGTGLSSHELNQPGCYKDVKDTSCVAMFKVVENEKSEFLFDALNTVKSHYDIPVSETVFFLAWTTTPWTLPSNLGLTVGRDINYVLIKTINQYPPHNNINIIVAKELARKYFTAKNIESDKEFAFDVGDSHNVFGSNIPYLATKATRTDSENEKLKDKLLYNGKINYHEVLAEFKGSHLEGISYEQLLPFEANKTDNPNAFKVLLGDFVTTEDGTGIVHTAPAFGADDFKIGKKYDIGILVMVDKQGKFIDGMGEFTGRYVKNYTDDPDYEDVNVDICVKLKKENRAFKIEKYEHSYPHCWRTDKPILYYPLDSWFIKTTALKERMVELNKTIRWKPKSTGEGRFGNWLENMVDWNLSRSRFWGTPLPIWRTEDGSEELCIGSMEELVAEAKKSVNAGAMKSLPFRGDLVGLDLHKPYVDEIVLMSPSGKPMTRIPDLIDVWFDSGAMPFAQWHFPFENKETFAKNYPADFIAEGVDQTRGWFYTLHAISALLKEDIQEELKKDGFEVNDEKYPGLAYRTCVSNGLVLDKNGNKMSKRLGNAVDPFKTIATFGADATRWYLITNASPWDNLKFDIDGIKEVQRKFFGTLYNTYQFFVLYANVDGFAFEEEYIPLNQRPEIDSWILSSLNTLIKRVTDAMDEYEPTIAGRLIEEFVDEHLSNWYVRLSRRRFWKGEYEHDKICAYQTLYECLEIITRLIAPVSPFFSDAIFQNLNEVTHRIKAKSVHHANFPVANEKAIDRALEERMQLAQDISSLILSLRKKVNIKVRQPLQRVLIPALSRKMIEQIQAVREIILAETNVKSLEMVDSDFIKKKAKANYKTLGKKYGTRMKWIAEEISNLSDAQITGMIAFENNVIVLNSENAGKDEPISIRLEDIEISTEDIEGYKIASRGNLTVALDTTITDKLKKEGDAREFVNRVQNIRKESGFELTDRIFVNVLDNDEIKLSINEFKNYICAEILADSLNWVPQMHGGTDIEVNDILLKVSVNKKG